MDKLIKEAIKAFFDDIELFLGGFDNFEVNKFRNRWFERFMRKWLKKSFSEGYTKGFSKAQDYYFKIERK